MEKATQAREENKLGEELEQIKLCVVNAMAQGLDGKISANNLQTQLNGIIAQTEIEKITEAGPWIIQGNCGREYKITNSGLVNAIDTMDKAIISSITVEERSKVPIVISNGDNIEEIKSCTIADTSIATVAKDTDGTWKITGGIINGEELQATTTMSIEGKSGKKIDNISVTLLKVTTAKDVIPVPTNSTTSAYVKYAINGQTEDNAEMCRVLYNDNEHGLQIITTNSVDVVTLGKNDNIGTEGTNGSLAKAQNSYNYAIENLNNKALNYIKTGDNIVADARCVGSLPTTSSEIFNNKNSAIDNNGHDVEKYSEFSDEDKQQYNSICWNTDVNYIEDESQLKNIGEYTSGYWLASRVINVDSSYIRFAVRYANIGESAHYFSMWRIKKSTSIADPQGTEMGFRPIFLIKDTAKIKSGTGTESDPYILEAGE